MNQKENIVTPMKKQSSYLAAKNYRETTITIKRYIKDFVLITIGIFCATFGLKGFLLTNHFIDGGATGISLLVTALTGIPLYVLIIGINIPFVFAPASSTSSKADGWGLFPVLLIPTF